MKYPKGHERKVFGKNLEMERRKKDWNQEDLAKASEMNVTNVSRYETAKMSPGLESMIALADALGCSLDTLAGRDPYAAIHL